MRFVKNFLERNSCMDNNISYSQCGHLNFNPMFGIVPESYSYVVRSGSRGRGPFALICCEECFIKIVGWNDDYLPGTDGQL